MPKQGRQWFCGVTKAELAQHHPLIHQLFYYPFNQLRTSNSLSFKYSKLLVCKLAPMHRGEGEMEEAASPDGKVESWISWELTHKDSLGPQDGRSLHSPTRIFKVYGEALRGWVTYLIQMKSTPHCSIKAVSLNTVPAGGTVGPAWVPRTGEGAEEPNLLDPARGSARGAILSTFSNTE